MAGAGAGGNGGGVPGVVKPGLSIIDDLQVRTDARHHVDLWLEADEKKRLHPHRNDNKPSRSLRLQPLRPSTTRP
jgi:hypothetical protein